MKKVLYKMVDLLEWIVAAAFCAVLLMYVFHRVTPASQYTGEITDERNEQIKSVIVWRTDYSKKVETQIINNLNMLPDSILNSWLETDCHVLVYPQVKGSLDVAADAICEDGYTIAYNDITAKGGVIQNSDIYILGSPYIIDKTLLHEMGHFVYYQYFGMDTSYVLPNSASESKRFIENERDGQEYYLLSDEYFAEMFAYTIRNGTSDEYKDTYVMDKIIQNFCTKK